MDIRLEAFQDKLEEIEAKGDIALAKYFEDQRVKAKKRDKKNAKI